MEDKLPAFPLAVSKGSVSVRIYHHTNAGYSEFKVSYYHKDKRKLETFADYAVARARAEQLCGAIASGSQDTLLLKGVQKSVYERALNSLRPSGTPLDVAADRYATAAEKLGEIPLIDVIEYYLRRHPRNMPSKSVREVVDNMIAAKAKDGASEVYLRDLRFRLGEFAEAFRCPIRDVDAPILNEWLRGLKCSGRTRNNTRSVIATMFKFAESEGLLPAEHIDFKKVAKAKEDQTEIEIFTVDEMVAFLAAARMNPNELEPGYNLRYATRQGLLPLLVLGGFAGMRTAEVQRQLWSDISLERGYIRVTAAKGHTAQKRLIPIAANLRAWLAVCRQEAETCCDYPRPFEAIQRLAARAKIKWKHNALRHSFCSYRMAETQDAAKTALEAGNSPRMIFRHYRELVSADDAKAWFAISPE